MAFGCFGGRKVCSQMWHPGSVPDLLCPLVPFGSLCESLSSRGANNRIDVKQWKTQEILKQASPYTRGVPAHQCCYSSISRERPSVFQSLVTCPGRCSSYCFQQQQSNNKPPTTAETFAPGSVAELEEGEGWSRKGWMWESTQSLSSVRVQLFTAENLSKCRGVRVKCDRKPDICMWNPERSNETSGDQVS